MPLPRFLLLTALGAGLWNACLAAVGVQLQERWDTLQRASHWVDAVVVLLLAWGVAWWIRRRRGKIASATSR
jgi:membrane protein DedA with SNARE-associated domain